MAHTLLCGSLVKLSSVLHKNFEISIFFFWESSHKIRSQIFAHTILILSCQRDILLSSFLIYSVCLCAQEILFHCSISITFIFCFSSFFCYHFCFRLKTPLWLINYRIECDPLACDLLDLQQYTGKKVIYSSKMKNIAKHITLANHLSQ